MADGRAVAREFLGLLRAGSKAAWEEFSEIAAHALAGDPRAKIAVMLILMVAAESAPEGSKNGDGFPAQ